MPAEPAHPALRPWGRSSPPSARPQPVLQGAGAEAKPEEDDAGDRGDGLQRRLRLDPGDDWLPHPFDDEAEGVVFGDRLRRLDHQLLGEEGRGEEEDDEDQREEALDDAGAAGAQGDRRADAADGDRRGGDQGDRQQRPGDAAFDVGAEDQPDRQEPERGEEPERRRARQPPEDDREAGDRRGEEAIGEAHLDVDRESDAAAVAGQHHRLHHRAGQHELEEALDRREAGQFDPGAGAAGLDRQQQGGEDDDRADQLRPPEGLADRARAERPDHPHAGPEAAHAGAASASGSSASSALPPPSSPSRWCPVFSTKTSSRVGRTSSRDSTPIPASSSARTTRRISAAPCATSSKTRFSPFGGRRRPSSATASSASGTAPSSTTSSMWGLPTSLFSSSGVPSATIRPRSMIPTLSASWSASSRYWVVRKTVVPSSFSACTSSQIVLRLTGSSPVVGSSRNSTRGSWTRAAARSSRRFIPPE